jgi:hypothetical protein
LAESTETQRDEPIGRTSRSSSDARVGSLPLSMDRAR